VLDRLVAAVAALIVATVSTAGYGGIVALMAIESACIPLPSEIIMPFSGYLVSTGRFDLVLVALAGAIGCNLGSTAAYAVGAHGGRTLVERWGGYALIRQRELALADWFFERFGGIAVFVARLLPLVRTFIAFPAGIARMRQVKFQIYTFAGSFLWCYALAYVGQKLGERWESDPRLKQVFHRFDAAIAVAIVIAVAFYLWLHLRHRLRGKD
jgi:membrane protein DedA with SNARE-associated domain